MITCQNQTLINIKTIPVNFSIKNTTLRQACPQIPNDNPLIPTTSQNHILILFKFDRKNSVTMTRYSSFFSLKFHLNPLSLGINQMNIRICPNNPNGLPIPSYLKPINLLIPFEINSRIKNTLPCIQMSTNQFSSRIRIIKNILSFELLIRNPPFDTSNCIVFSFFFELSDHFP